VILSLKIEIPDSWDEGPSKVAEERVQKEIFHPVLQRGVSDIHPDMKVWVTKTTKARSTKRGQ
jgi:hypothetical protein